MPILSLKLRYEENEPFRENAPSQARKSASSRAVESPQVFKHGASGRKGTRTRGEGFLRFLRSEPGHLYPPDRIFAACRCSLGTGKKTERLDRKAAIGTWPVICRTGKAYCRREDWSLPERTQSGL